MKKLRDNDKNIFVPSIELTDEQKKSISSDSTSKLSSDFDTYVFRAGEDMILKGGGGSESAEEESTEVAASQEADTLEYLLPNGDYKQNKYKLKFSPELITGGFSYDNFYGLQGQSFLAIAALGIG